MSESTAPEQTAAPAADAPAPTIDDTMNEAFAAIETREAAEAAPIAEAAPRGADGRFAAAPVDPAAPVAPAEVTPPVPSTTPNAVPDYLTPYAAEFARRGLEPGQAVSRLLDTWQKLETSPEATLKWLAGQYGVDWGGRQAAPQQPVAAADDVWVDPNIRALQQELDQIKGQLHQSAAQQQAAQNDSYNRSYAATEHEVQAFATKKAAADGVDFNILKPAMAALIQSGQAADLEAAYDMAVFAIPQTRAAKIAADRKTEDAARTKLDAEKTASARRAAIVNIRSDMAGPTKPLTMDESLSRTYDEIVARG